MCAWSGGTFTRANPTWTTDASLGIGIEAGRHDAQDNDFTTGINQCLNKDGSNSATGNLNLGGYLPTNIGAGTAAAPAICAGNDVNTGIFSAAADQIGIATNGTEKIRINASGNVGIGTTAPGVDLDVQGTAATVNETRFSADLGGPIVALRKSRGASVGTNTIVQSGDILGVVSFNGANGTGYTEGAYIAGWVDGTPGASNDMPGRITFATTADGAGTATERMRISSTGELLINKTTSGTSVAGSSFWNGNSGTNCASLTFVKTFSGTANAVVNYHSGAYVGGVDFSNTATSFPTSSDYRLKENVVQLLGALGRLNQLKPCRFNFIAEPDKTIDGFLAHEVADVIPNAVHGEKDAVKEDGTIKVQSLDHSKIVPLLTAGIQELNAKVEALEARIAALEA